MAKKKAKKKKSGTRRRSRRMSGDQSFAPTVISGRRKHAKKGKRRKKKIGALTGSETGDLILGGLMGVVGGVIVDRINPLDARIGDGAKILLGGGLAISSKDPLWKGVGLGIAANGLTTGSHNFGFTHGLDNMLQGMGIDTPGAKDSMLIEMNGMTDEEIQQEQMKGVDVNSTKFVRGTNMPQPKVITGESQNPMNGNGMPSVIGW